MNLEILWNDKMKFKYESAVMGLADWFYTNLAKPMPSRWPNLKSEHGLFVMGFARNNWIFLKASPMPAKKNCGNSKDPKAFMTQKFGKSREPKAFRANRSRCKIGITGASSGNRGPSHVLRKTQNARRLDPIPLKPSVIPDFKSKI